MENAEIKEIKRRIVLKNQLIKLTELEIKDLDKKLAEIINNAT
jgi:hypothetical protein